MATCYPKGARWFVAWMTDTGRKTQSFGSEEEARVFHHRIEVASGKSRDLDPDRPKTLNELWKAWHEEKKDKRTIKKDEEVYRVHVEPYFGGNMSIEGLTTKSIKDFLAAQKSKGYKANTINLHRSLLSGMVRIAAENAWMSDIKLPAKIPNKGAQAATKRAIFETGEEIKAFLDAIETVETLRFPAFYRAVYATAIYSGLRPSEIRQLEWHDVDLEGSIVVEEDEKYTPKTEAANRDVPIVEELRNELKRWKNVQDQLCPLCHRCNPVVARYVGEVLRTATKGQIYRLRNTTRYCTKCVPYVFPNERGKKLGDTSRVFGTIFKKVREKVPALKDRKELTFYSCRHTYATRLANADVSVLRLKRYMGHAHLATTSIYANKRNKDKNEAKELDGLNIFGTKALDRRMFLTCRKEWQE